MAARPPGDATRQPRAGRPPRARRPDPSAAFDAAADAVDEMVVLLGSGVALPDLGRHLGRDGVLDRGADPGGSPEDRVLHALLTVCRISGAPVAAALGRHAIVLRELAQAAREVELAAAGPRATARIVGILPLAGVVIAVLLGFDVAGVVTGSVLGVAAVLLGAALAGLGAFWSERLVRGARPGFREPGLMHELTAAAVRGGLGSEAALSLARRIVAQQGIDDAVGAAEGGSGTDGLAETIADVERLIGIVHRSGAGSRALLEAQATLRRHRGAAAARLRAEKLPTALLLPLGVCSLPAFVLLGVVPALLAVVSSTVV